MKIKIMSIAKIILTTKLTMKKQKYYSKTNKVYNNIFSLAP